jgi:uncharacterized protein YutE (UPF0331/DUF86 family)
MDIVKYNGVIDSKLKVLEQKLQEIEEWDVTSLAQIQASSMLSNALERALQVAVETMIDISERILALEHIAPQASAAANMEALAKLGVIDSATPYMEMVRFRNFIVHRYEHIDLDIIYDIATKKLALFRQFADEIYAS